ncbi:hypothetical protein AIZ04_25515, partial [Salmonella enterica subsp. enterica serovar Typhimurium]
DFGHKTYITDEIAGESILYDRNNKRRKDGYKHQGRMKINRCRRKWRQHQDRRYDEELQERYEVRSTNKEE